MAYGILLKDAKAKFSIALVCLPMSLGDKTWLHGPVRHAILQGVSLE